ncbi:phage baseplate assembly protein V [Cupriavidus basilensis]
MMQQIQNQMLLAAQMAQAGRAQVQVGIVTSYDPGTASAKVRLQPEDPDSPDATLTGWLPVASPWVGNGWGVDAPVTPGDQVEVKFLGAKSRTATSRGASTATALGRPARSRASSS